MILRIPKTTLLVLFLAIILVIVVFFLLFLQLRQSPDSQEELLPTPTSIPVTQRGNSPIKAQNISPSEDISGETILNPSQKVTYTLSEDVSPTTVRVQVSPPLPVKLQQGSAPNSVVVFPDPPDFWAPDVPYTITLFDSQNNVITTYAIKVPKLIVPEVVD